MKENPAIPDSIPSASTMVEEHATLVDQAARSVKWSFLYNLVPRFITPFSTMILAALLSPADFGLVAISTFVVALSRILVDLGLSKAVIQRKSEVDEAASICFWINLSISILLYLILWVAAPSIALAYHNNEVKNVIRVAALSLPLYGSASIPKALLTRKMEFRSLFWVNSSFLIIQAIASVILALTGIGYWAMILGQLIGLAFSVGLAWLFVHWHPGFTLNWPMLRSMLGFSLWVMVSSFQNWLVLYADNVIAGLFLGVESLGVYSLGYNIAILIPGFLVASLGDVAYPSFCKLQEDPRKVGEDLVKLQALIATFLFPIAFGLSAIAPTAIHLLYGQKWNYLGTVIAILVIMPGLSCIWSLNENAYQAVGKPELWTKLAGFSLLALLPMLWFSAPYGLLVFTVVRFLGGCILPLGNMIFGASKLGISLKDQLKSFYASFSFALIMSIVVYAMTIFMSPFIGGIGVIKLLGVTSTGAIIYFLLIWRGDHELWNLLFINLRRILV
jgi:O-antigen/teichoic acid export membrane protein